MVLCCNLEEVGLLHWLVCCMIEQASPSKADFTRALATLVTGSIFLGSGIAGLKNRNSPIDFKSLVQMGFGAVQPKSLVSFIAPSVCVF